MLIKISFLLDDNNKETLHSESQPTPPKMDFLKIYSVLGKVKKFDPLFKEKKPSVGTISIRVKDFWSLRVQSLFLKDKSIQCKFK